MRGEERREGVGHKGRGGWYEVKGWQCMRESGEERGGMLREGWSVRWRKGWGMKGVKRREGHYIVGHV